MRLLVSWPQGEPTKGIYADAYLADVKTIADAASAAGMKVIVTVCYVPRWASDKSFWGDPPSSQYSGYQDFYPMTSSALDDFQAFADYLATTLKGGVFAYECWNEPNLWPYLFPQRTMSDGQFAAHTYLKYLHHFSAGIRAGDPAAVVVAGATAPAGDDNGKYRTPPQMFAQQLKNDGAADYFDAFSHHPYVVGGRPDLDPGLPPAHPDRYVELQNISTLLKIFPTKPFYLTEYGFSTDFSWMFGAGVTETQQAAWLRKAYRMAATHPQVKMLMWYLIRDQSRTGSSSNPNGCYTGLRRVSGGAKPSWYAFAGGNRLTLVTPTSARRGTAIRLQGRLSCASVGGVMGKTLQIKRKRGSGRWLLVRSVTTGNDGNFSTKVILGATQRYRLVWPGVVSSPIRLVRVR